jgi:hypothetical protein
LADLLGSDPATNTTKINACLVITPKKMKPLMMEAGLTETLYTHLNELAASGKVVKTEEGYSLSS